MAIAEDNGLAGPYVDALKLLGHEVDSEWNKHITINATGAIAAVLLEIKIPASLMRGLAVISRAAGLLPHIPAKSTPLRRRCIFSTPRTPPCPMRRLGKKEEPRK